jgi:hypothetical protein
MYGLSPRSVDAASSASALRPWSEHRADPEAASHAAARYRRQLRASDGLVARMSLRRAADAMLIGERLCSKAERFDHRERVVLPLASFREQDPDILGSKSPAILEVSTMSAHQSRRFWVCGRRAGAGIQGRVRPEPKVPASSRPDFKQWLELGLASDAAVVRDRLGVLLALLGSPLGAADDSGLDHLQVAEQAIDLLGAAQHHLRRWPLVPEPQGLDHRLAVDLGGGMGDRQVAARRDGVDQPGDQVGRFGVVRNEVEDTSQSERDRLAEVQGPARSLDDLFGFPQVGVWVVGLGVSVGLCNG